MTEPGLDANPEAFAGSCDGPDCDEDLGMTPAVTHPSHDADFCSVACRNRWQNRLNAGVGR